MRQFKRGLGATTPSTDLLTNAAGNVYNGSIGIGAGGSASSYNFTNGLSNDPQLASALQDLTPSQLQTVLTNPSGINADLIALNNQLISGFGLPCGTVESGDPNCNGGGGSPNSPNPLSQIPVWGWLALGVGALFLIGKTR